MGIIEALEKMSAFITMVADTGMLNDAELENIETIESVINAYVYRKEHCDE